MRFVAIMTLVLEILSYPNYAHAQGIQVLSHQFSGDCDSSSSVTFSPNNTVISVLYSGLAATANSTKTVERKNCSVSIDMQIPKGMQLETRQIDYRGYVDANDNNGYGMVNSHHFFKGGSVENPGFQNRMPGGTLIGGFTFRKEGPVSEDFLFEAKYEQNGKTHRNLTRCNGKAKLRINTYVQAGFNDSSLVNSNSHAEVGIDSVDLSFTETYTVFLAPCDKKNLHLEKICKKGTCPE